MGAYANLVLLTVGSKRQATELCSVASDLGYIVAWEHVREDLADWAARDTDAVYDDLLTALRQLPRTPDAVLNFGRASVPDGIRRIASAIDLLVRNGLLGPTTKVIGPSAYAAEVWGNKALIADSLRRLDLPIPLTQSVDVGSAHKLGQSIDHGEFPTPVVVKVVDLTGGAGMRYARDSGEFAAAVRELSHLSRPMVITEFVGGDEVSIDVLRLGSDTLVYPPGFKTTTTASLTHADHKIKVNGVVRSLPRFTADVCRIVEAFDLQGFFSLEGIITRAAPPEWRIIEGATRVTNNLQMQDASLGFDSFAAVIKYIAGLPWLPSSEKLNLALSIPIYQHKEQDSVKALAKYEWVRQVKIEDLAQMPDSRDTRRRLTVKVSVTHLTEQLAILSEVTGDSSLASRVISEVDRVAVKYAG